MDLKHVLVSTSLFLLPCLVGANCGDESWTDPLYFDSSSVPISQVRMCLEEGMIANLKSPDSSNRYFLHDWADRSFNAAILPTLLDAGAELEVADEEGNTPLHIAVKDNLTSPTEIAGALIRHGANPNAQNDHGDTPLHFAATRTLEIIDIMNMLVQNGADPKIRNRNDVTAGAAVLEILTEWSWNVDVESAVRLLISLGTDPSIRTPTGNSLIIWAAEFAENPATIAVLLEAGADLNSKNGFGQTPLHVAAGSNPNQSVIRGLVAAGASLEARDEFGFTALHIAAGFSDIPSVLSVLIDEGAGIDVRDENGQTPLHAAAGSTDIPGVLSVLIDEGAGIDVRDENGRTPLHTAVMSRGRSSSFEMRLIEEGLREPIDHEFSDAENPVFLDVLIEAGANVEARDYDGNTPLHIAGAVSRNPAMVSTLVSAGSNLEARNLIGRTPLHQAARSGNVPAIIHELVGLGANLNARQSGGSTPLHLAVIFYGNVEDSESLSGPGRRIGSVG